MLLLLLLLLLAEAILVSGILAAPPSPLPHHLSFTTIFVLLHRKQLRILG
jgi:hypothetical protein